MTGENLAMDRQTEVASLMELTMEKGQAGKRGGG
jgi:hypothetical protein